MIRGDFLQAGVGITIPTGAGTIITHLITIHIMASAGTTAGTTAGIMAGTMVGITAGITVGTMVVGTAAGMQMVVIM